MTPKQVPTPGREKCNRNRCTECQLYIILFDSLYYLPIHGYNTFENFRTGVTLVRTKQNGQVNDGFDFEGQHTYDNTEGEGGPGTSDGKNGDAILY